MASSGRVPRYQAAPAPTGFRVTAGRPASGPSAEALIQQAGFAACGDVFCPTTPLCWGGVVAIGGEARPPKPADCTGEHSWEVFAAIPLPADAVDVRQDELMARNDIGAACSEPVMAAHTGEGHDTTSWVRDAWPVRVDDTDVWILHCIPRPEDDDHSGSAFSRS